MTFCVELSTFCAVWDSTDELNGNKDVSMYSDHTPPASVVLRLSDIEGVDLSAVGSVSPEFSENSGCIVLRDISLGK